MIALQSVSHRWSNGKTSLRNVTLTLKKGEFATLRGPSGCGKSTLAKILTGHLRPSEGNVTVDGRDITGRPNRETFLVHQEDDLFPWLRVTDQIQFALEFGRGQQSAEELINLLRLGGAERLFPSQLSGGMKKRLALARALALSPSLLVIDEAFSSLDPEMREELLRDLQLIWKTLHTTILLVTHTSEGSQIQGLRQLTMNLTGELT